MGDNKFLLYLAALLTAALLAYHGSFDNAFVLDDHVLIGPTLKNPIHSLEYFIADPENVSYRPLQGLALSFAHAFFKSSPASYHILNLVLLSITSLLGFALIFTLTNHFIVSSVASILFLVHPINSIFINYPSTINLLLMYIFTLLGFLCLISRGVAGPILAAFFLIFAVLCHESAILFVLFGGVLLLTQRLDRPVSERLSPLWPSLIVLASYLTFRLVHFKLHEYVFTYVKEFEMSLSQYLAGVVHLYGWFLTKLLRPSGIVFTWGLPSVAINIYMIAVLALVISLMVFMFRKLIKKQTFFIGILWLAMGFITVFFGCLSKPKWFLIIEPYWLGLSVFGFCLVIASCVRSKLAWIAVICLGIFWIRADRVYNLLWYDEKIYCYYWEGQFPGYKTVHQYLSKIYEREQDLTMARLHNQEAMTNAPEDMYRYYLTQGKLMLKAGQNGRAKAMFQAAQHIKPNSEEASDGLKQVGKTP